MSQTSPIDRPADWHIWAAVRWMMVALLAFTAIAIAGRGAAQTLTTSEIVFYRCWASFAILLIVIVASGRGFGQFRTTQLPLHMSRSVIHLGATFTWLYALPLISLAELIAIEFTAPLWTGLLAVLLLGERLTVTRALAALIGFVGVLVVVRPVDLVVGPGTISALIAAVCFGCHYAMTKKLTRQDSPLTLLFYTTFIQAGLASLFALGGLRLPNLQAAGWIGLMSLLGLAAHFSLSRAFSLADAIVVAPMDFLRLPASALVGALLYAEVVHPLVLVGAGLVVFANGLNIWGERRSTIAAHAMNSASAPGVPRRARRRGRILP